MRFHKHNLLGLLLMSAYCALLAACANQIPSAGTEPSAPPLFCSEAKPIIFSRLLDTPATIAQIKAHNAVGVRLCHWVATP